MQLVSYRFGWRYWRSETADGRIVWVNQQLEGLFGYSRSTFREAFRRLAAERLVSLVPNRGVAVQRLTPQEMADLFEIRELMEGHAARRAAERIGEGDHRRRGCENP